MGYAAEDRIFKIENANKKTGTGARVEVLGAFTKKSSSGPNPKVAITFQSYNSSAQAGAKITSEIKIFLDLWEAAVLSKDILSGNIFKLGMAERKSAAEKASKEDREQGKFYCDKVWQSHLAGTPADTLANRGQARPDGMSESRVMEIVPGTKTDANGTIKWVVCAKSGAGEEMANGLIAPKYSRPEHVVRVSLTNQNLKEMACALEWLVGACMFSKYNSWSTESKPVPHIECDEDGVIIED